MKIKNPKVEITYLSEDQEKITVTLDELRKDIGKDYDLSKSVENFGFDYAEPKDKIAIIKIKINDKIIWKRKSNK